MIPAPEERERYAMTSSIFRRLLSCVLVLASFTATPSFSQGASSASNGSTTREAQRQNTPNDSPAKDGGKPKPDNTAGGEQPDKADVHEFFIRNFQTESGIVLPEARLVYGTYGHLNAAHDNVVLLPSHYMADHRGYEWLIGPDRALDPSKLF